MSGAEASGTRQDEKHGAGQAHVLSGWVLCRAGSSILAGAGFPSATRKFNGRKTTLPFPSFNLLGGLLGVWCQGAPGQRGRWMPGRWWEVPRTFSFQELGLHRGCRLEYLPVT